MDLEFHQLDLHYEGLRVRDRAAERALLCSLEEYGQQLPIVVVRAGGEPERYRVIDGYRRIRALKRLGRDTVQALVLAISEEEALMLCHSLRSSKESTLEVGWLLCELKRSQGWSGEELARRLGRSSSWVSRRRGARRRHHGRAWQSRGPDRDGPRPGLVARSDGVRRRHRAAAQDPRRGGRGVPRGRGAAGHPAAGPRGVPRSGLGDREPASAAAGRRRGYALGRRHRGAGLGGRPGIRSRIFGPDHPGIWFALASAYLRAGKTERAAERFRRVTESPLRTQAPLEAVRSLYFLGQIHEQRGEEALARGYYRRFVDHWRDGDLDRDQVEHALRFLTAPGWA